MKLLGDSLAHAMHLTTAARTRLLIVGQIILDALARQVRRQRPAAALLSRRAFDGWQTRVRKFGDSVRCTAGVILIGDLLLAFVMEHFILWSHTETFAQGMLLGFICWVGFVLGPLFPQHIYEGRPRTYFAINAGYWLIGMVVTGGILAIWH